MEERIFWVQKNYKGFYEVGYPLTLEQLKSEFGSGGFFDVDAFLAGDTKEPAERKEGYDTYRIFEVSSKEELNNLMTWKGFVPENSLLSRDNQFPFPDFVAEDLRLPRRVMSFSIFTSRSLPISGTHNKTADRYMEKLCISEESLNFVPTNKDQVMKRISDTVQGGAHLSETMYNGILEEYRLTDYLPEEEGIDR